MAAVKIIGKVAVKVMPDTSEFKDRLRKDLEKIEKSIGDLKVDVIPEVSKAAAEKVKAQMEHLKDSLSGDVLLHPDLDQVRAAEVTAALALLTRDRHVSIEPDLDQAAFAAVTSSLLAMGGARVGIDLLHESLEKLLILDKLVPQIALTTTKITALGTAAIATTGHLFSLGSSIASIAGAGLALPGLLGGIVTGLGITTAAFADFNKVLPEVGDNFAKLQNQLSSNFWDQALGPIREMVNTLWPAFSAGVRDTATALGGFFGALADSLHQLLPALEPMFANLIESVEVFTGYSDAIAGVFTKLGLAGAQYLPALAEWFGDLIARFDEWLSDSDRLNRIIDTGITNLQAFGKVIAETSSILSGIADAATAAGGATLVTFAESLERVANTVNSAGFQKGLTATFEAAFEAIRNFNDNAGAGIEAALLTMRDHFINFAPLLMGAVGEVVGAIGTAFADPAVVSGISTMLGNFATAIEQLAPAAAAAVQILGALAPVVGALAVNISALVAGTGDRLVPTFERIADAAVPVINILGGFFQQALEDLTPVFDVLGKQIARVIEHLGPLISTVQDLWNLISPVLIPALKIVATILGDALVGVIDGVRWVFEGLIQVIEGVVEVFKGLWDVVAGIFTLDFGRVVDGIGSVFGGLGDIIIGAVKGALGALWAVLNGTIVGLFRTAASKIGLTFIAKLMGPFEKVGSILFKPFAAVFKKITGAFSTAIDYIINGVKSGGQTVGTVWSRLIEVLKYPFQILGGLIKGYVTVWVNIFKTAFNVIKSVVGAAWFAIRTIFGTAFEVIVMVLKAAWKGVTEFFQTTLDALYFVFKGTWDNIATFLIGLWNSIKVSAMLVWGAIKAFFDDFLLKVRVHIETVWNGITGFFTGAWNAIRAVFTNALNAVRTRLVNVWTAIRERTAAIWENVRNKIVNVWQAIRERVANAISAVRERIANVWDAIRDKTAGIWEAIRSKISGAWDAIKSRVSGAVNDVKSALASAWDAISTKVTTAWTNVKEAIVKKIGDIVEKVREIPGKCVAALAGIGTVLVNAGKDLIGGFIDGIKDMFGDVKDTLGDLTSSLTSWKGPESLDKVLLTPAGQLLIDGLINGLESRYAAVRASLNGLTSDIASQFDDGSALRLGVETDLAIPNISAISGLGSKISAAIDGNATTDDGNVHIDNITIPLEDLEQLKTLEDFINMLRVRIRQGVLA